MPEAAFGDALLVPASGEPVQCSSHYLEVASEVLAVAVQLSRSQESSDSALLRVPLSKLCTEREARLLVAAIYSRDLPSLLAGLPVHSELRELSDIAHRLGCAAVLLAVDAAVVRKCDGGWLNTHNALATLAWAQSRGLPALHRRAASYIATHQRDVSLKGAARDAGDNLLAVLQSVQEQGAAPETVSPEAVPEAVPKPVAEPSTPDRQQPQARVSCWGSGRRLGRRC